MTTNNMALDATTEGGVLKLKLTGDNNKIVEFPQSFIKLSGYLDNMINESGDIMNTSGDEDVLEISPIISGDFMDFYIKYCTWMQENPETVNKRYKENQEEEGNVENQEEEGNVENQEEEGNVTRVLDKESELSDWENDLFFEMTKRFKNGYEPTHAQKEFFEQWGSQITTETRSFKETDKEGKPKVLNTQMRMVADDEERAKFNAEGMIVLEKNQEQATLEWKEYLDDPYQTTWTSLFYCIDFFDNEFMKQATRKFFAQEILPRWTPDELKALSKEEFEAMNFKERYSEYDSNRDKLDYDNIDNLDRYALPKRTSKELANLMGRTWIENPHATEDPVEYLNDPFNIYTLVCPGTEKCNAKDCVNNQDDNDN
jgi:hypothetical protein